MASSSLLSEFSPYALSFKCQECNVQRSMDRRDCTYDVCVYCTGQDQTERQYQLRFCSNCEEEKLASDFYPDSPYNKDGAPYVWCLRCYFAWAETYHSVITLSGENNLPQPKRQPPNQQHVSTSSTSRSTDLDDLKRPSSTSSDRSQASPTSSAFQDPEREDVYRRSMPPPPLPHNRSR